MTDKFDSIIFDVDGTLWDSTELVAEAYNQAFEQEGVDVHVTADVIRSLCGKPMDAFFDHLLPNESPERKAMLGEKAIETENALLEQKSPVYYPEVKETMEKLAKKVPLFIVSNCQKGYIELVLKWADLGPVVQDYLCFGDTGTSKGQTILTLMKRNNLKKSIYVGDVQGDADACKEAGIPIIYCKYGFGTIEEPYAVIGEFKELDAMF